MTRSEIQEEAVRLMRDNSLVILEWCTGLGKSKAAIDIINDLGSRSSRTLLVVSELAHKENWKQEFLKWKVVPGVKLLIETYASLQHHKGFEYDLIILDEAHHSGSDLRIEKLEGISTKKVLALSATLPTETEYKLRDMYGPKAAISKISLQDAISWGILPEPKIKLIPIQLDNISYTEILEIKRGREERQKVIVCTLADRWKYLKDKKTYPDINLRISCTPFQKYTYITETAEFWKKQFMRTQNEGVKIKWMLAGSERKRFLGNLKTNTAADLISRIKDKRFVCFCTSIEQAEELGGENAIHSKKKGALSTISSFNRKEINHLFAIGMIQEGQNLTDIEVGIIIQLDGEERAFIQKSGRAMRAEEPELYILYYEGTRDEEYLKKALEGINPEFITKCLLK